MVEKNTQAVVLQQPNDQMIHLDLQHSTDWVVVISVITSAFISFIGFLVTIYIVKKSTESQIESNAELIRSQEEQKRLELEILYHHKWFMEVVDYVTELDIRLSPWLPELISIQKHLMNEKNVNTVFKISDNDFLFKKVQELEAEARAIKKYINKIIIHFKLRELLSKDLEKKLLALEIGVNEQTKCLCGFENCEEDNKALFLKNINVGNELQEILAQELCKFKKAA